MPAIELSAATAFEGRDVAPDLLSDYSPAGAWIPHLDAGTLWVTEAEGQVVAFLAARPTDTRLHIDEVDVHRSHQGQGIGRRMILEAIAWARAHGFLTMSLTTFRSIPWNGPFYASLGFREWIDPPPAITEALAHEAEIGLKDRWAMRLDL